MQELHKGKLAPNLTIGYRGILLSDAIGKRVHSAVRAKLKTRLQKLDFDNIEFSDVIQFLRDVSGLVGLPGSLVVATFPGLLLN